MVKNSSNQSILIFMDQNGVKKLLGARIRQLRKKRTLSQESLAEKIGIDPKHLSRIEVGRSYPSMRTLEKIATALKVDLKDIFDFFPEAGHEELKQTAVAILSQASEQELRMAVKLLRALII